MGATTWLSHRREPRWRTEVADTTTWFHHPLGLERSSKAWRSWRARAGGDLAIARGRLRRTATGPATVCGVASPNPYDGTGKTPPLMSALAAVAKHEELAEALTDARTRQAMQPLAGRPWLTSLAVRGMLLSQRRPPRCYEAPTPRSDTRRGESVGKWTAIQASSTTSDPLHADAVLLLTYGVALSRNALDDESNAEGSAAR